MEPYISKTKGPCVILAGAGTGKTYSIVEKIQYLIKKKTYKPEKIVCLTFSNEAVNTLRQRILPDINDGREPIIRTFHSYCADLLRKHGEKIGISPKFKIILPDDGKILMHKHFKMPPSLCTEYMEEISIMKDRGYSAENLEKNIKQTNAELANLISELEELKFQANTAHLKKSSVKQTEELKTKKDLIEQEVKQRQFIQAWKSYEKIKQLKHGLDYADLNHKALELLNKHPEVANDCDYLIIDEFQDTNKLQCQLIEKLAMHRNLTVVGDLNQSIYRFRGAYKDNFDYIKKAMHITQADLFKLDKSHRSTNKILDVAHELIKNNYVNPEDCFHVKSAKNESGEQVQVWELKNSNEEVRKTIEIIRQEMAKGTELKEICVIFRTHQQANLLKKQLQYKNIPYTTATKDSLLKSGTIKKIRAYLILINKYQNSGKGGDRAWWDLLHTSSLSKNDEIQCTKALRDLHENECITKQIVDNKIPNLSEQATIQLNSIIKTVKTIADKKAISSHEIIKELYQLLGLEENHTVEDQERILALEKFISIAKEFSESDSSDLNSFIYHLEALDALGITLEAPTIEKEGIKIMTNHATKGLEYVAVIINCLAQKKFPLERTSKNIIEISESKDEDSQLAEERRLFYVGCTRAKKRLYLTYAKEYGKRSSEPSQFLKEINYQNNQNIEFVKDSAELYKEPIEKSKVPEIQTAASLETKELSFSSSSLQKFDECQKLYEFKYIYNMPDPTPRSWEAITLGNFVHRVLEVGVSKGIKTAKEFEDCAKTVQMEEFKDSNLEEAIPLIKTFVERNKNKYNKNSRTEEWLSTYLDGIKFAGYADRIDINDEGELTIVDYKTGKSDVKPKYRNWQLGLYALASRKLGTPKTLVLEMLQKDHPLEFQILPNGIAREVHSTRTQFSLQEVKQELVETAKQILQARQTGFKPCPIEKHCQFCEEFVYPKDN